MAESMLRLGPLSSDDLLPLEAKPAALLGRHPTLRLLWAHRLALPQAISPAKRQGPLFQGPNSTGIPGWPAQDSSTTIQPLRRPFWINCRAPPPA